MLSKYAAPPPHLLPREFTQPLPQCSIIKLADRFFQTRAESLRLTHLYIWYAVNLTLYALEVEGSCQIRTNVKSVLHGLSLAYSKSRIIQIWVLISMVRPAYV